MLIVPNWMTLTLMSRWIFLLTDVFIPKTNFPFNYSWISCTPGHFKSNSSTMKNNVKYMSKGIFTNLSHQWIRCRWHTILTWHGPALQNKILIPHTFWKHNKIKSTQNKVSSCKGKLCPVEYMWNAAINGKKDDRWPYTSKWTRAVAQGQASRARKLRTRVQAPVLPC